MNYENKFDKLLHVTETLNNNSEFWNPVLISTVSVFFFCFSVTDNVPKSRVLYYEVHSQARPRTRPGRRRKRWSRSLGTWYFTFFFEQQYIITSGAFTGGAFGLKPPPPVRLFWDPKNINTPPCVFWIREYETRRKGSPNVWKFS